LKGNIELMGERGIFINIANLRTRLTPASQRFVVCGGEYTIDREREIPLRVLHLLPLEEQRLALDL